MDRRNSAEVLYTGLNASISGATFYFYTDSKEVYPAGPHFSDFFYNTAPWPNYMAYVGQDSGNVLGWLDIPEWGSSDHFDFLNPPYLLVLISFEIQDGLHNITYMLHPQLGHWP